MQIKVKLTIGIAIVATLALVALQMNLIDLDSNLRRVNHETYSSGEANYDFCMKLCTDKGGINCGGKRKGCCQQSHCKANKIYGWEECDRGFSQRLGTDRCIGSWD